MFDKRYEVILADTAEARRIHYRLRYQVYCLEEGFEAHDSYPDQMERDSWDNNSVHFLVRSKQSKEWIAAMRLVLQRNEGLPLENLCSIDPRVMPFNHGESAAEVSRICIKNTFRRNRQPVAGYDDSSACADDAEEKAEGGYRPAAIQKIRDHAWPVSCCLGL